MTVRVATFNCENLFARYRFKDNVHPTAEDGFTVNDLAFAIHSETEKAITARAIRATNADILALQEVESLEVLDRFNSRYLGGLGYTHRIVIDSHDPRHIDVAVLSRHPFTYIQTHRHERNAKNTGWLYSRDCLEVDLDVNGKALSLYVNHFKSMMEIGAADGRAATRARRLEQSKAVAALVDAWWKPEKFGGNFVVLGDLNDYMTGATGIAAIVDHPGLVNVATRLKAQDRWTHFYARANQYEQLDYLLLSKSLAARNPGLPVRTLDGLPWRATRYTGPRFDGVGQDDPKASDHVPLAMDLELD